MARVAYVAVGLACWPLGAGCLPFFGAKPEPPHPPAMVQRFVDETSALGVPPSPPRLPDVTRTMARAVESLPRTPAARDVGQQIEGEARAMESEGRATELEHARRSAAAALHAVESLQKPAGSKQERQRVLDYAHYAVDRLGSASAASTDQVGQAYRAVGEAMLTVTGGRFVASGRDLPALIARFAVADAEEALRWAPQVLYAMAGALSELPGRSAKIEHLAADLRGRAERLAGASTLEQAPQLKAALLVAVEALDAVERDERYGELQGLSREARAAVRRISDERPLELQRGAVQDAFRVVSDGIAIAAAPARQSKGTLPVTTR